MRSLKITLLLAVLVSIFVLTVSGTEKVENVNSEVSKDIINKGPSSDVFNIALGIKKKNGKPSQA